MFMRAFKGFVATVVAAGALGSTAAASHRALGVSNDATQAPTAPGSRRRPLVQHIEEGCRELPVAPVAPPAPANCS